MSKIPPYALFLNICLNQKKDSPDTDYEGCDEVLAYMAVNEANGKSVKITNLVQSLQFGTGPTVHRKVSLLAERGLINISKSAEDGRAKNMVLTSAGMAILKDKSRLMKQCFE